MWYVTRSRRFNGHCKMDAMMASIMSDVRQTCSEELNRKASWLPTLLGISDWALCKPPAKQLELELEVKLVVTPIGPRLPRKLQAYHTSVLVGDQELAFGLTGMCSARGPKSHKDLPRSDETTLHDMGVVRSMTATDLRRKLIPHFRRDSYDLLRKNCNSFSDVCLSILVGARLDREYRYLEEAALSLESSMGLVRMLSGGQYTQNPEADAFGLEEVISEFTSNAVAEVSIKRER